MSFNFSKMEKVKIKICGVTNKEDAIKLLNYDIDALGFIVTKKNIPSKIDLDLASKIISELKGKVMTVVGVGNLSVSQIVEICGRTKADVVQLQFGGSVEDIKEIRRAMPNLKIWKTVFTDKELDISEILELEEAADAILIHSKEEQWPDGLDIAQKLCKPFVLAGGLDAGNIKEAIKLFSPWMVDLISGAETIPGKKDFEKVEEFINLIQ